MGIVLAFGMVLKAMTKLVGARTTWRGTTYRGDRQAAGSEAASAEAAGSESDSSVTKAATDVA